MSALTISIRRLDDGVVLALSGDLDLATVPRLQRELERTASTGLQRTVLDLTRIAFMDSSGLRAIVDAAERASASGSALELVRGPDHVHRIFEITLLDERLSFVPAPAGGDPGSARS